MCIIIRNTTGKPVPEKVAADCVRINPDGFGIIYLDGKGDHFRTLDMETARLILATETRPYVAHCRYATVGEVSAAGIHPFAIGRGRYLFQNGTLDVCDTTSCDTEQLARSLFGLSDTRIHFILQALSPICRFAVADGKREGVSETFGKWHKYKGVEYSKTNVLPYNWDNRYKGWKPVKPYKGGGVITPAIGRYEEWCDDGVSTYSYQMAPSATDRAAGTHLVAVYGTLKQGKSNHGVMKEAKGFLIGTGHTGNRYRLCVNGLPYLIRGAAKDGFNVSVEVYEVDSAGLAILDALEGHPDFYRRESIQVKLDGEVGTRKAYTYFVDESYDTGVYMETY